MLFVRSSGEADLYIIYEQWKDSNIYETLKTSTSLKLQYPQYVIREQWTTSKLQQFQNRQNNLYRVHQFCYQVFYSSVVQLQWHNRFKLIGLMECDLPVVTFWLFHRWIRAHYHLEPGKRPWPLDRPRGLKRLKNNCNKFHMPADTTEGVTEHSARQQPSMNLHAPVTAFMFSCSGTQCTIPKEWRLGLALNSDRRLIVY